MWTLAHLYLKSCENMPCVSITNVFSRQQQNWPVNYTKLKVVLSLQNFGFTKYHKKPEWQKLSADMAGGGFVKSTM